jgi:AcrR family transcriptional regulator
VGIHNSTLFHYFPDKRSLWASALDAVAERQLEWLERLEADAPPSADGFASVVDGWDRHLATSPAEARVLLEGLAGPDAEDAPSPPLLRLRALVEDWIGRAGEAGLLRAPSPEAAADRLLGMLLFRAARRGAASTKKAGEPNEGPARSFLAGLEWK